MTGNEFIKFVANMKGMRELDRARELMEFFELDAEGTIKKMSKGMKQKVGIVCAFMQDSEILILDEPTSGLDPLMQNKFVELISKEKAKGKTILMSSHLFEEVERTCDRIVIIRQGRIVDVDSMERLQKNKSRIFYITFDTEKTASDFAAAQGGEHMGGRVVTASVSGDMDSFIKALAAYPVRDMDMRKQTLEEFFLQFYGGEEQ